MIVKIKLKNKTSDNDYTQLCNKTENQGIFVACGNCDDKWIMLRFDNNIDYLAWLTAAGIVSCKPIKANRKINENK